MKDCKFSISKTKTIVWSWPCIARDLDDICNQVDGIYPTYDSTGELYSVTMDLKIFLASKNENDLQYINTIINLRKALRTADESDPIDRKNLFELLSWINENENDTDNLEILT